MIWNIREICDKLNTLEERDCRQKNESVARRNSFDGKVEMSWSNLMIAKHSATKEAVVG